MRDHSRTGVIGQSPEDPSKRRVAMIDGPSLAHSVYQTTRSGESIGASAFGGNVHYSVTAEAVARWLQLLGDHGFEMCVYHLQRDHKYVERLMQD